VWKDSKIESVIIYYILEREGQDKSRLRDWISFWYERNRMCEEKTQVCERISKNSSLFLGSFLLLDVHDTDVVGKSPLTLTYTHTHTHITHTHTHSHTLSHSTYYYQILDMKGRKKESWLFSCKKVFPSFYHFWQKKILKVNVCHMPDHLFLNLAEAGYNLLVNNEQLKLLSILIVLIANIFSVVVVISIGGISIN
jgi:hypothetical protein